MQTIIYKDYEIGRDPPPIPIIYKDYDGPGDSRSGRAASVRRTGEQLMSKTVRKERPDFKEKRPNERRLKDRQRAEIREYYQNRS